MSGDAAMPTLPMLLNILAQAGSLEQVWQHNTGAGRDALAECARLIRSATGRLFVSGMGASFFAARPAAAALARQGRPVLLTESSELLHFGSWTAGDVAVLISRSGASVEVLRLAEQMRAADVRIVGVTNVPGSPLTQLSDAVLVVGAGSDQIVAVQTYTGTLLALLLLVECFASAEAAWPPAGWAEALTRLDAFVRQTIDESPRWENFLAADGPLYLLGRGSALAAVHEGVLLFHETAKLSAIGMSSGQFRHGPVEAVDHRTRAIVIGSPSATRALDVRLALDLDAMGVGVRWIGPPSEDCAGKLLRLGGWPEAVPAALDPLFDIVPLQVAAYRAALLHGVTPGDFRYASEITADEAGFPLFEASLT